jgi:dUTP pyrophosphatase
MDIESIVPVKFVKLSSQAVTPTRQKIGDAGYDLYATENVRVKPMSRALVSTGLSIEVPEGYYARIAPRSGLAVKNGIDVLAGVVDSSYRGEVKVVLMNLSIDLASMMGLTPSIAGSNFDFNIKAGDRIAQLIIEKYHAVDWQEVTQLSSSERTGGFGSTGA